MSNIIFADEEEALGKINIDDLYDKNMKRDLKQVALFNKMLNRVHKRIQTNTRMKRNEKYIWFLVPEFLFGEPVYDQSDCIAYIISKLVENGFYVRYVHPHSLFISWEQWIPSYVRNEIKKKTGKVINEKGQVISDAKADTDEPDDSDPNSKLLHQNTANNSGGKKQYTPIGQYKPSGMVYNPDILEKLEKKITFKN
jgi:hypothetical protein